MSITVLPIDLNPASGHVINLSPNVMAALSLLSKYLQSTYSLQAADTKLEAAISTYDAQIVQDFEDQMNSENGSDNYLWQLEHLTPDNDPNGKEAYSADVSRLTSEYGAANAANQALVKVTDGNNQTAQNVLNQNAQGQPGIIQTMGTINGIGQNLVHLIQG